MVLQLAMYTEDYLLLDNWPQRDFLLENSQTLLKMNQPKMFIGGLYKCLVWKITPKRFLKRNQLTILKNQKAGKNKKNERWISQKGSLPHFLDSWMIPKKN